MKHKMLLSFLLALLFLVLAVLVVFATRPRWADCLRSNIVQHTTPSSLLQEAGGPRAVSAFSGAYFDPDTTVVINPSRNESVSKALQTLQRDKNTQNTQLVQIVKALPDQRMAYLYHDAGTDTIRLTTTASPFNAWLLDNPLAATPRDRMVFTLRSSLQPHLALTLPSTPNQPVTLDVFDINNPRQLLQWHRSMPDQLSWMIAAAESNNLYKQPVALSALHDEQQVLARTLTMPNASMREQTVHASYCNWGSMS